MIQRRPWEPEEDAIIAEGGARGDSLARIAATLIAAGYEDRTPGAVQKRRRRPSFTGETAPTPPPAGSEESIEQDFSDDTGHLFSRSTRIRTVEELLDRAKVDREVWEVDRFVVNQYEMGAKLGKKGDETLARLPLYQVKAWLRRKRGVGSEEVRAALLADLREHAPVYPPFRPVALPADADRHLLELCIFDPHFGKLAWREETGEDYDLKIASRRFRWAVETLLHRARGYEVERIVFPVGNDAIHADNLANTTTRGTRQDVDSRWFKMFRTARLVYQQAIDRCAEIAPVDVVVVPGNHDQQSALALGEVLDAQYHRTDRVTVLGGPRLRKYYEYGSNMILYTHGSEEKPASLPILMATEEPEMWARTRFREAHTGHQHRRKETQFVGVDEQNGVRVRVLGSLAGTDAWHFGQGYTQGWKAAEGFVWSHAEGLVGNFSANLGEEDPERREAA